MKLRGKVLHKVCMRKLHCDSAAMCLLNLSGSRFGEGHAMRRWLGTLAHWTVGSAERVEGGLMWATEGHLVCRPLWGWGGDPDLSLREAAGGDAMLSTQQSQILSVAVFRRSLCIQPLCKCYIAHL